jgi:hypothetical protein
MIGIPDLLVRFTEPRFIDGTEPPDDIFDLTQHRVCELMRVAVLAVRLITRGFSEDVIGLFAESLS